MASKSKKNRLAAAAVIPPADALPALTQVLAWVSLAWAIAAIILYWNRFSWLTTLPSLPPLSTTPARWSVFAADLKALLLGFSLLAGMTAFGSYVLRLFRLSWRSRGEEFVFSVGLGLAATGYVILALGALQLYRPPVFWALWGIGLALAWARWFRGGISGPLNTAAERIHHWHAVHKSWWPHWALLWITVGVAVLMTFVPELFYDAMVYHVGVPKFYLFEGGIRYYPAIHSQFPFLRQMLNVIGLALEGERLAKFLHWSSAPLIIATYHVLASRHSYPKTALIAALAFFSMPMVNMNLWTAGIDVGLAAFALLAFLAWVNGITEPSQRGRWFTLAGVFCGFCFSSKYPGLIVAAMICGANVLWLGGVEKNWRSALAGTLRIGTATVIVTVPWLIKSWALTGNPMYPYLFQWFGGRDLLADRLADFIADTQSGAKHNPFDLLKAVWTGTFADISSFAAPGVFLLGLMGFFLMGLFRKDVRSPWYGAASLFFVVYWLCVNAMTDRIRLGIPGLAIGCFVLAHTAGVLYHRGSRIFRTLLSAVVAVGALTGLLSTLPTIYHSYAPWDLLMGKESREDYLSYTHPGMNPYPATPMYMHARGVVPAGRRLLIIGDEKTSPCPVPFLASGVHNDSPLVQWSKEAGRAEDLAERFKQNKISHMMVNVGEAMRLSGYRILNWDNRSMGMYAAFADKHLRLVHQEQIRERFFKGSSPLLLYEFMEQPRPETPPSVNILLQLFEEVRAPTEDPLAVQKRRQLLQSLDHDYPGVASIQERLRHWKGQEQQIKGGQTS